MYVARLRIYNIYIGMFCAPFLRTLNGWRRRKKNWPHTNTQNTHRQSVLIAIGRIWNVRPLLICSHATQPKNFPVEDNKIIWWLGFDNKWFHSVCECVFFSVFTTHWSGANQKPRLHSASACFLKPKPKDQTIDFPTILSAVVFVESFPIKSNTGMRIRREKTKKKDEKKKWW